MIDDADDSYRFYENNRRISRKSHVCSECNRVILPREEYYLTKGLSAEGWDTWKTCLHCFIGQEWLSNQCNGFVHGFVWDDLREHFDEYAMLSIGKLIVGMNHKWQRFDGQGMMKVPALPQTH